MPQPPYRLDEDAREAVLSALRQHCELRGWKLMAAHVRTNHVHVIVEAEVQPERILIEFKSYASRALNRLGRDGPDRRRWARHGSTRWLFQDHEFESAMQYVVESQGARMAVFVADEY